MKLVSINSEEQFDNLISNKNFILFSGDYCPDCKIFELVIEKAIQNKKWDGLVIYHLDVVLFPEISKKERIMSIPNLKLYNNNKIIETLDNYDENSFNDFIQKNKFNSE